MIYFSNVRKLFASISTVCSDGWFGIDCNQRCSTHCRHQLSCNHFTGQCGEGCDAGWVKPNCNTGKKNVPYYSIEIVFLLVPLILNYFHNIDLLLSI